MDKERNNHFAKKWNGAAVELAKLPRHTQDILSKERKEYLFQRAKLTYVSMEHLFKSMYMCKSRNHDTFALTDTDVLVGCKAVLAALVRYEEADLCVGADVPIPRGICVAVTHARKLSFKKQVVLQELLDQYALQLAPKRRSVWWFYSGYDNVPTVLWYDVRKRFLRKVIKLYVEKLNKV